MELEIIIGNTKVDYRDDIEIPVVLRSPLFSEGSGSFIFNFSLPATESLKKELDYYHRPARSGNPYITRDMIVTIGALKYMGKATIIEADEYNYEISMPVDDGDLASILKEKTLRGLDLGGDRNIISTVLSVVAETDELYAYNSYGSEPFSEVIPIAFTVITENNPVSLNVAGTSCTISQPGDVMIVLDFKVNVIYGLMHFRLYRDGVLYQTVELLNDTNRLITILNYSGVLTWDVYVQNSDANEPGMFIIDATLSSTAIDIKVKTILNEHVTLYPDGDYVLFPIENPDMLMNIPDDLYEADAISLKEIYKKFFPVMNYFANGKFPITIDRIVEGQYFSVFNLITPFPYLAFIISAIKKKVGIEIENNVFESNDHRQLVLFNLFCQNNFINSDLLGIRETINLTDHMPDLTIAEFWLNVCKLLGVAYVYDSKRKNLRLKLLKDIATDTGWTVFKPFISKPRLVCRPINGYSLKIESGSGDTYLSQYFKGITGLTFKGTVTLVNELSAITDMKVNDCYFVTSRQEYWYWNYDSELHTMNWLAYCGNYQSFYKDVNTDISSDTFELTTKCGTIMHNKYPFIDLNVNGTERQWLIPSTNQPGNFDGLQAFIADYSFAILFYHGLRFDGRTELYPFASWGDKTFAGEDITFEDGPDGSYTHSLTLNWAGTNGLYEKRYKDWIKLISESRGFWRVYAKLSSLEMSEIDFFKWYSNLEYRFLIKEIRFNIKKNGITAAELEILIK